MIGHDEGATEVSKPKRDFLIKKSRRLNELHLANLARGLANSEPVTPSKSGFNREIKSSRNTIDYLI